MSRLVVTREYGELIEGVQDTQAHMALAILADDQASIARYSQEMREWRACMDVCPMFVQYEGLANG